MKKKNKINMSKKDSTLLKKGQTWYVSKPPPPLQTLLVGV